MTYIPASFQVTRMRFNLERFWFLEYQKDLFIYFLRDFILLCFGAQSYHSIQGLKKYRVMKLFFQSSERAGNVSFLWHVLEIG